MLARDKVVIITRKTALEELLERHSTRDQARFYVQHRGASFEEYQAAHDAYRASVAALRDALPGHVHVQWIDRSFLPTFTFDPADLVITLGPDGLVVNTAKYLADQPLLAFNPDPARVDGVLVPFSIDQAPAAVSQALRWSLGFRRLTMAQATLNDGQALLALNDLFVGQRTHVSARYRIRLGSHEEDQSSSGLIVSTGAGSTGWFRSILTGAAGVVESFVPDGRVRAVRDEYRLDWESRQLHFSVREPFISKTSAADLVFGTIGPDDALEVTSHMPQNGVIFSDGVEEDFLPFNSGAIARVSVAERTLNLFVPEEVEGPQPRRRGRTGARPKAPAATGKGGSQAWTAPNR